MSPFVPDTFYMVKPLEQNSPDGAIWVPILEYAWNYSETFSFTWISLVNGLPRPDIAMTSATPPASGPYCAATGFPTWTKPRL